MQRKRSLFLTAIAVLTIGHAHTADDSLDPRGTLHIPIGIADTVDTLKGCLRAYADMVPAIEARHDNMRAAALRGFATATDLADYLVRKGMPFRDAHEVVGNAVAYAIEQAKDLSELALGELQQFCADIEQDVFDVLTLEGSVAARDHLGGTAPRQVRSAIAAARAAIS